VSRVEQNGWTVGPKGSQVDPKGEKDPKLLDDRVTELDQENIGSHGWTWRYTLLSLVRGSSVHELVPMGVSDTAGIIVLSYASGVKQWLHNSPKGIEQGFVLPVQPLPEAAGSLVLRGVVETSLTPTSLGTDRVVFKNADGSALRYSDLCVVDAAGVAIPSFIKPRVDDKGVIIDIHINDSNAVYPLTVDPLLASDTTGIDSLVGLPGESSASSPGLYAANAGGGDGDMISVQNVQSITEVISTSGTGTCSRIEQ
jgi:hypothetical protein